MNGKEIECPDCEVEFYIEIQEQVQYCPCCGEQLKVPPEDD